MSCLSAVGGGKVAPWMIWPANGGVVADETVMKAANKVKVRAHRSIAVRLLTRIRQRPCLSYHPISEDLTRRAHPTKKGNDKWIHTTVRRILRRSDGWRDVG